MKSQRQMILEHLLRGEPITDRIAREKYHCTRLGDVMNIQLVKIRIRFFVEADGDVFHAYCPELIGVHAAGDTEKEALDNAIIATEAYFKISREHDDPIPVWRAI